MKKLLVSALLFGALSSVMYGRNEHDENNNDDNNSDHKKTPAQGVPEIDPNSAVSAVFLLSSGVLMIKGRKK